MASRGAPALVPPVPLLEAYDLFGNSSTPNNLLRSSSVSGANALFWHNGLGGGHAPNNQGGLKCRRTAAAIGNGASSSSLEMPLGNRLSVAGINQNQLPRRLRYSFECWVRSLGAGAEFGVRNDPTRTVDGASVVGYSLYDAGGVWGMQRRLVSAGARTTPPVLVNVATVPWQRVKIIYTEGDVPTLEFLMGGVRLFLASGEAEMPETPTAAAGYYAPALASGGSFVDTAFAKYLVELLA
jgi:hypothetical protein